MIRADLPHRRGSFVMLIACGALLVALAGSISINAVRARSMTLAGTVLHIIRVTPSAWIQDAQGNTVVQPGDTYESWTDVADGLSKVVQIDGQGRLVLTSYEVRQPDGTFTLTTMGNGVTSTHHLQAPLVNGQIENGFWFGGESSLAGMKAEYASYLQHAQGNVVQTTLNGVAVRRFDARSADGLLGTTWLNQDGLPIQVEADHDLHQITKFPVIEELPAGSFSRDFFVQATLHGHAVSRSSRQGRH